MSIGRLRSDVTRRLALFAVVGAIAVAYTGARYAKLTDHIASSNYVVHVELASSGGIFPGAEVTYRGVPIGRVGDVIPVADGIRADLDIEGKWRVPAGATAAVRDRSAVGEQYVDLAATGSGGGSLHAGDTIPLSRSTTPLPPEELLKTLDTFAQSVDTTALSTTVAELATGFSGEGQNLGSLIDDGASFVAAARDNSAVTVALLHSAETVMNTQIDQSADLRAFTHALAQLSGTVADKDAALRNDIVAGAPLAQEVNALAVSLMPILPQALVNLAILGGIGDRNLGALEETLVAIPHNVFTTAAGSRGGWAQFLLQTAADPSVCEQGYIPPSQWRSTQDLTPAPPNYSVGCADPNALPRGSANAH